MPTRILPLFAVLVTMSACSSERRETAADPTYRDGVGELLRAKCAGCHAGSAPAAGWSAERFVDVVACTASGLPVTVPNPDGTDAPLVAALARADHRALVSDAEAALLRRWVSAGAPAIRAGVHAPSFADPRSPASHGAFLRTKQYAPMRDAEDKEACRRCHDGALPPDTAFPARLAAPGATPCTTCHTEEGGPFACTTCHGAASVRGAGGHASPPRDPCFHPEARGHDAHVVHAGPSAARAEGLACATCHPTPSLGGLAPPHADGFVSVWIDPAAKGKGDALPAFDASAKTCTGTCHARGGARPVPAWTETSAMTCNDCHRSPPPSHYKGACSSCHREANADGTALTKPVLHVNGRVDLGDGSGACGACHGRGADPWPTTGAHQAHARPRGSKPVACETCHDVPLPNEAHPVGTGGAAVRLGGLAISGARQATFDAATKTCGGTYCHAYVGGTLPSPQWNAGPSQAACGTCHAAPPPLPHVQETNCAASGCHEGLTSKDGRQVTPLGAIGHVDGVVDRHGK